MRTFILTLILTAWSASVIANGTRAAFGVLVGLVIGYFIFKLLCRVCLDERVRKELGL